MITVPVHINGPADLTRDSAREWRCVAFPSRDKWRRHDNRAALSLLSLPDCIGQRRASRGGAGNTDRPIAGLLRDLKQRGLLEETLVVWGGEFGRQPTAEYAEGTGRDHNADGFTMWMAGGGVKGGVSIGQTDELGNKAVDRPLHVRRLHATILHLMGMDPNALSYFHAGLDQKLVGVEGAWPIRELLA